MLDLARRDRDLLAAVRRTGRVRRARATSPSACCREGKKRHPGLPLTAGDATRLPFRDGVFDAVTISFGLRNVQDTDAALRELYRVDQARRPGGDLRVQPARLGARCAPSTRST